MNTAVVPWGAIIASTDRFINPEYLPTGFSLKEPSKLKAGQVNELLEFWQQRQDDEDITFAFAAIQSKDSVAPSKGMAGNNPAGDNRASSQSAGDNFADRSSASESLPALDHPSGEDSAGDLLSGDDRPGDRLLRDYLAGDE